MNFKILSAQAIRWVWVGLVLVLLAACGDTQQERGQKFIARGIAAMKEGNNEQALYYFDQARQMDSCSASALNNIGTVHFNEQRYGEALNYYGQAIACEKGLLDPYFNRANTLIKMRNYDAALSDLDYILTQKPDTATAHFTRGLALSRVSRNEEAMESFARAGSLDTSFLLDSRVNSAAVLVLMRRYAEAESALRSYLAINPREANLYNSLALVKIEQGRYDSALMLVNKALSLYPGEPYFLNNRGYIYVLQGRLKEGGVDIDQSITIDPYNGWAYRNKGVFYLLGGDAPQAARLLEKALALDPYVDHVNYYLGLAYKQLGRATEACAQFRKAEELDDSLVTKELIRPCKPL